MTTKEKGPAGRKQTVREPADQWQVRTAKAHFSDLFARALERPQRVTRRGRETVVVLAADEYDRLVRPGPRQSLVKFLRGLRLGDEITLPERTVRSGRDLDL